MFLQQFCLVLLVVLLLPTDVPGQRIVGNVLKGSKCSYPNVVMEGERIVLNAVLNTSQSNSSEWPLHQIYLQQYSYNGFGEVRICDINITRDGCHGPRQGSCGYCDSQVGDLYNLVFNITVMSNGSSDIRYQIKWIKSSSSSSSISSYFYLTVLYDYPYATTSVTYYKVYSVQDIINNNFVVSRESTSVYTSFTSSGNISWRYSDQSEVSTLPYLYASFNYNISVWDSHIDDMIQIKFEDQCSRNWSFTVPVTNLPELDCEPPELYWNKSTGFQLVTRCRIPRSSVISERVQQLSCSSYLSSPYWYVYSSVSTEGNIFTCTSKIPSNSLAPNTSATLNIRWSPVIDIQFTNGSGQNPRVLRFHVNGSRSITVEPGADVSFECKVYGNPTAVAVLVGTGLGRIQEERSDTDLLLTTLAKVQCEDSGRYTCKGVSGFGSTSVDRLAYVDINVRCPPTVRSHLPSDSNRKFNFDPGSNILVTLEVYGYPVPTDFGLQLGQSSSSSEVDKDQYSISSVELNPSLAVLTLTILSRDNGGPETYVFRISNGANSSLDFQFEAGKFEAVSSPSSWMYAFIAVICILGVLVIIIIIIYFIKKRFHNKGDNFTEITVHAAKNAYDERQCNIQTAPNSKIQTSPTATEQSEKKGSIRLNNTSGSSSTELYDKPTPDEEIYENLRESMYEEPP